MVNNNILTVGDLKKLFEGAPDDMPIYKEYDCDIVETGKATRGYQTVSRVRWEGNVRFIDHLQIDMIVIE